LQLTASNITIKSSEDTTVRGGVVAAENALTMDVDGNLTVESLQDKSKDSSWTLGGSVGYSGSANASVNGNMSNGRSKWVYEQTSLTAGGKVDIDVVDKTTLTGAVIASDTGDLTLATGSLEYSNIKDRNSSTNFGGGASLTYGDEIKRDSSGRKVKNAKGEYVTETGLGAGLDSASYGFSDSRQTNFATIGEGTIIVRDGASTGSATGLEGLNRDVSKAQYSTMDIGVQLEADKTTLSAITNPLDTYQDTVEGLGQIAERGRKIEEQTHIVEKTGNLVSYGAFGLDTDRNVVTAKLTDQMSDAGINLNGVDPVVKIGQKVMGNDGTVYVVEADGLKEYTRVKDYFPSDEGGIVDTNAYGKYLEDKLYNTWQDSTPLIRNAMITELEQVNPEAAGEFKTARADLIATEKREQAYALQLETNSSLRNMELATYSETRKLYYSEHSSYLLGLNGTGAIGAGGTVSAGGYYSTGTSDYGTYVTKGVGGYSGVVGGGTVEFTYIPSGDPNSIKGKTLSIGGSATVFGVNVGVQINQPLYDDNSINTDMPRSITIDIGTKYTTLGIPCVLSGEGHTIINDTKIKSYSSD